MGIGTMAGALLLLAALLVQSPPPWLARLRGDPTIRPELQALVDAAGSRRLFEPRPTGGFAYGPLSRHGESLPPAVRAAAEVLVQQAPKTALETGATGVARLVLGDPDGAVRDLSQAVTDAPDDARLVSDLAAALLVRAARPGHGGDAARAAGLAERAVDLNPALAEAWFNRALAFEALGMREEAVKGWDQYLQVDAAGPWADEARRRRTALVNAGRRRGDHPTNL